LNEIPDAVTTSPTLDWAASEVAFHAPGIALADRPLRNPETMKSRATLSLLTSIVLCAAVCAQDAEPAPAESPLKWQAGPTVASLGSVAEINVPEGFAFIAGDDTRLLMEAMQNPKSGREVGLLIEKGSDWFILFEFDEVGYVPDDEKAELDATAMLKSIRAGNDAGNKERREKGWPELTITGWELEPRYNDSTKNLEWAIRGESQGSNFVNHNTRLLGREGVMRVTLVADPALLPAAMPQFATLIAGFDYTSGHKYAEFKKGDKMAKYGLTALVVGGASAVAVKSGLFKWLWKGLVVAGVAVAAFVKKLISGRSA
jgi:uncharacterized membrane-anchored protein